MKYTVEKRIAVQAGAKEVSEQINNLRNWKHWSPWYVLDTNTERIFSSHPEGEGATMEWISAIVGKGKMTLVEARENRYYFNLEFFKPFKGKAQTDFVLEEREGITEITWTLHGEIPFFMFFMKNDIVAMNENDYERGLLMLKEVVEKGEVTATSEIGGVTEFQGFDYVGTQRETSIDDMPQVMSSDLKKIQETVDADNPNQIWFAIYEKMDFIKKEMKFISGVNKEIFTGDMGEDMIVGKISSTKVAEFIHKGSYKHLGNTWTMAYMWMRSEKIKPSKQSPFEIYVNDLRDTEEKDLITKIIVPIK